jgi:hypothetical protein
LLENKNAVICVAEGVVGEYKFRESVNG